MLHRALALTLAVPAVLPVVLLAGPTSPASAATPTCHGKVATIVGTSGNDRLVGTDHADVIVGLGGNDTLVGKRGDDTVCGGPGADRLLGGRGDDALYGGLDQHVAGTKANGGVDRVRGDVLEGGPGDDLLAPGGDRDASRHALLTRPDMVRYSHSAHGVDVDLAAGTATGEGHDTVIASGPTAVVGSPHDDRLAGTSRPDLLVGGKGSDTESGRGGADLLADQFGPGRGTDVLRGGRGGDFVLSFGGSDHLLGGPGRDSMVPSTQGTADGGHGGDTIILGAGDGGGALVDGGAGRDNLTVGYYDFSSAPRPFVTVDRASGTVTTTGSPDDGVDEASSFESFGLSGTARWTFAGTDARDELVVFGGPVDAQTFGGDDVVAADRFNDTIDAGAGTDTVFGGGGTDTCLNAEKGSCAPSAAEGGQQ
ncbi:MAG: calcium-binding protein, partial [Nocardioides sp.]